MAVDGKWGWFSPDGREANFVSSYLRFVSGCVVAIVGGGLFGRRSPRAPPLGQLRELNPFRGHGVQSRVPPGIV
jgi:hypothetical protein